MSAEAPKLCGLDFSLWITRWFKGVRSSLKSGAGTGSSCDSGVGARLAGPLPASKRGKGPSRAGDTGLFSTSLMRNTSRHERQAAARATSAPHKLDGSKMLWKMSLKLLYVAMWGFLCSLHSRPNKHEGCSERARLMQGLPRLPPLAPQRGLLPLKAPRLPLAIHSMPREGGQLILALRHLIFDDLAVNANAQRLLRLFKTLK